MNQEYIDSFKLLFDKIYLGNKQAEELSFTLLEIAHQWDDCVDQDKPIDRLSVNKAWCAAMIHLPTNALYSSMPEMPYLIKDVYFKWCAANDFEKSGEHLEKAYMLRAGIYGLFVHIAGRVVGFEHAESVSSLVWSFYGESLDKFKQEVNNA